MYTIFIPILQLRKQKHRELKEVAQGHIRAKGHSQDLNPGLLVHPLVCIMGVFFIWEALLRTKQVE